MHDERVPKKVFYGELALMLLGAGVNTRNVINAHLLNLLNRVIGIIS